MDDYHRDTKELHDIAATMAAKAASADTRTVADVLAQLVQLVGELVQRVTDLEDARDRCIADREGIDATLDKHAQQLQELDDGLGMARDDAEQANERRQRQAERIERQARDDIEAARYETQRLRDDLDRERRSPGGGRFF